MNIYVYLCRKRGALKCLGRNVTIEKIPSKNNLNDKFIVRYMATFDQG
jgi:hypothetical protein